ncbi:hypothetical protein BBP40_006016 [Aspergillus hancockii]|nr:hypothetical protein BBP40_006016 [Aspergillus hancockii]
MPHSESSPRIHVLGLGSIGAFTAHALSEIPSKPSVTLLLHRESLLDGYQKNGNKILLKTREGSLIEHGGYHLEVYQKGEWHSAPSSPATEAINTNISHLIVSVKATQTVSALKPLKHRLSAKSTILFLQNGCGTIDEVTETLFPDPHTRPNYIVGVISHGMTLNRPFVVTHTGFAAMSLGLVPRASEPCTHESSCQYLLENLPLSPRLDATSYPYTEVLQIQLEKLAVNAFCNPFCALSDAKNGFLFTIPDTRREILTEISSVVLSLPELRDVPGVRERFAVDRLEATVNDILTKTAETMCSMVWDLRAGRET